MTSRYFNFGKNYEKLLVIRVKRKKIKTKNLLNPIRSCQAKFPRQGTKPEWVLALTTPYFNICKNYEGKDIGLMLRRDKKKQEIC